MRLQGGQARPPHAKRPPDWPSHGPSHPDGRDLLSYVANLSGTLRFIGHDRGAQLRKEGISNKELLHGELVAAHRISGLPASRRVDASLRGKKRSMLKLSHLKLLHSSGHAWPSYMREITWVMVKTLFQGIIDYMNYGKFLDSRAM